MQRDRLENVCSTLWSIHRHFKNPGSQESTVRRVIMVWDGGQRTLVSIPGGEIYFYLLQKIRADQP
jgi:hypothetical protein